MKRQIFQINALNAITNVVIINIFISIIMISALLIICMGGNSKNNSINSNNNNNNNSINNNNNNYSINNNKNSNSNNNNNNNDNNNKNNNSINDKSNVDSDNLLSSQASDAAVGMLTELGVNHMGIYNNPTETEMETEIEQNFLTHNCNKFCANPKGSSSRSTSSSNSNNNKNNNNNNNSYNNNNSKNEKTINRTPVAQINEIIKNLRTRGCCCLGSKSPTPPPQLGQHEQRASWSRATHGRCFGKLCCSRTNVTNVNVGKIRESYRFADLKAAALTSPQSRTYNQGYRVKRFVIFDGSGVVKFVAGPSFPVILADKQRSVSVVYNFQAQYTPPPRPIYWWSFVNTTTFAERQARAMPLQQDASRAFIYTAIESLLESKGLPGSVCLLKAICFVSQQPLDGSNVFHALLNAILTPAATNIDSQYLEAQAAGRYGVNCAQSFKECPNHTKWLQGVKLFY